MRPIAPSISYLSCFSAVCSLTILSRSVVSFKEDSMTHHRRLIAYATGRMFAVAVLAVFGILSMPGDAAAQSQVGTLVGNVRDESGGAIPGATVTAREVRTNISRTAVSNEAGNYTFTNVASGVYRIEAELVGFKKFTRENVEVNVNTTVRVDIALSVGALEES